RPTAIFAATGAPSRSTILPHSAPDPSSARGTTRVTLPSPARTPRRAVSVPDHGPGCATAIVYGPSPASGKANAPDSPVVAIVGAALRPCAVARTATPPTGAPRSSTTSPAMPTGTTRTGSHVHGPSRTACAEAPAAAVADRRIGSLGAAG